MIKRLLLITMLGCMLSGCIVAPLALIGPAASGFSTASIVQSGTTTMVSAMVKKSTGRSLSEHAFDAIIIKDSMKQSYFPEVNTRQLIVAP